MLQMLQREHQQQHHQSQRKLYVMPVTLAPTSHDVHLCASTPGHPACGTSSTDVILSYCTLVTAVVQASLVAFACSKSACVHKLKLHVSFHLFQRMSSRLELQKWHSPYLVACPC